MFRPMLPETVERRARERIAERAERRARLRERLAEIAATGNPVFVELLAEFDAATVAAAQAQGGGK